jgi:tetratricopeptide (TPR) repeat protein
MNLVKSGISAGLLFFTVMAMAIPSLPMAGEGGQSVMLNADQQFEYAAAVFAQKDYDAARAEFNRFVFFFPDDPRVHQARIHIGLSDFYLRNYQRALDLFQTLHEEHEFTETGMRGALHAVRTLAVMGRYGEAADFLHERLRHSDSPATAGILNYYLGWLYVETGQFAKAGIYFDAIDPDVPVARQLPGLKADLGAYTQIPSKSPTAAALLSIVPGGGYFYLNRYQDAFISLVLNGLMAWAAVGSFEKDLYGLGGVITLVGAGFYAGNIYGATTAAHQHNQRQQEAFARALKNRFSVHLFPGPGGDPEASWSVQYRF